MKRLTLTDLFMQRTSIICVLVCMVLLTGCNGTTDPTVPDVSPAAPIAAWPPLPPASGPFGSIAGFVVDETHGCIKGARVEMTDGPQAGAAVIQTYCDFWGYEGDNGYSFDNLPIRVGVTLRATAAGYKPKEIGAVPTNPFQYTTMIFLTKEK